jgi:hypothetical protein
MGESPGADRGMYAGSRWSARTVFTVCKGPKVAIPAQAFSLALRGNDSVGPDGHPMAPLAGKDIGEFRLRC